MGVRKMKNLNKILCYIIMSMTWFVGYFACNLILEFCLAIINFIMQEDFYNTKNFSTWKTCQLFILLNPFCIVCYTKCAFLRRFRNIILFSIVSSLLFLGLYMVWNYFNGFNPSHKVYLLCLAFLLSILAFIKLHFIYKNKILEFATISMCEFSSIFIIALFPIPIM